MNAPLHEKYKAIDRLGCQNDHIKDIANLESNKPVFGWAVFCQGTPKSATKECKNWNCPSLGGKKKSSIKTKLSGMGRARLHFGNCNKNKKGIVKVLLDDKEIAKAKRMKLNEMIEFHFNHDSTLEIVGMSKGTIQINDFEVLHCKPGK